MRGMSPSLLPCAMYGLSHPLLLGRNPGDTGILADRNDSILRCIHDEATLADPRTRNCARRNNHSRARAPG